MVAVMEVPDEIPIEAEIDLGAEDVGVSEVSVVSAGVSGGVAGGVPGGIVGGVLEEPSVVPPAPPAPVRVGGDVKAPRVVHEVAPIYPLLARNARLTAVIIMEVQVDDTGRVVSVKVLRGDPLFDQAAIESVRQRRYEPLVLSGQPWPFVSTVVMQFNISNRA